MDITRRIVKYTDLTNQEYIIFSNYLYSSEISKHVKQFIFDKLQTKLASDIAQLNTKFKDIAYVKFIQISDDDVFDYSNYNSSIIYIGNNGVKISIVQPPQQHNKPYSEAWGDEPEVATESKQTSEQEESKQTSEQEESETIEAEIIENVVKEYYIMLSGVDFNAIASNQHAITDENIRMNLKYNIIDLEKIEPMEDTDPEIAQLIIQSPEFIEFEMRMVTFVKPYLNEMFPLLSKWKHFVSLPKTFTSSNRMCDETLIDNYLKNLQIEFITIMNNSGESTDLVARIF